VVLASDYGRQCSSGLQAIASVAASIRAGFYTIGLAGGVETMSMDPMDWAGDMNPKLADNQGAMDCMLPMGESGPTLLCRFTLCAVSPRMLVNLALCLKSTPMSVKVHPRMYVHLGDTFVWTLYADQSWLTRRTCALHAAHARNNAPTRAGTPQKRDPTVHGGSVIEPGVLLGGFMVKLQKAPYGSLTLRSRDSNPGRLGESQVS
jgi:hypothetical protein